MSHLSSTIRISALCGVLALLGFLAACEPPPGSPHSVTIEPAHGEETVEQLKRIADALETIAAKDCR